MNTEILEKVAQWLEAGAPHEQSGGMGFHMGWLTTELSTVLECSDRELDPWVSPSCGTVGCIAGAVVQFTRGSSLGYEDLAHEANKIIGGNTYLDGTYSLFYPADLYHEDGREGYYATPQEAAVAVRHFMVHQDGVSAWDAAGFSRR